MEDNDPRADERAGRFYASIQGNRGRATRQGNKTSGIEGHVRGWDVGIRVSGSVDGDKDKFDVYLTFGSNAEKLGVLIGTARLNDDGNPVFTTAR
jgi:hypothetical protein